MAEKHSTEELLAEVHRRFEYKPETGEFIIKPGPYVKNPGQPVPPGDGGYVHRTILGKSYLMHRIVWLIETGDWPINVIDHIDGNRSNNKFSNLRDVTMAVNLQGFRTITKYNSRTGERNITMDWDKYKVTVMFNGQHVYIGTYDTLKEAVAARDEFKKSGTIVASRNRSIPENLTINGSPVAIKVKDDRYASDRFDWLKQYSLLK